ncbi:MAG: hypothetical protein K6U80_18085 [Firmicutes bacterium]|nr:hypothetical protein [Bacillota bacterium]
MGIKVFLDTNTLIGFFNSNEIEKYKKGYSVEFVTFEKCLYEWKNGIKRYFINSDFLVSVIKGDFSHDTYESYVAISIICRVMDKLDIDVEEINQLVDTLKKIDLGFEFGMALEGENFACEELEERFERWVRHKDKNNKGILRVKQFFKCVIQELKGEFRIFDNWLKSNSIKVILYEEVFTDLQNVMKFRQILNDSYLPTEDLEIIFSGLSSFCSIFLTNDLKIIKRSRTLGLNHLMQFVRVEDFLDVLKCTSNGDGGNGV